MYYVYILESVKNNRKYTGYTSDLKRRYKEHLAGKDATTKKFGKIRLIFYEAFISKQDAVRREKYLKTSKGKSSLKQIIRDTLKSNAGVAKPCTTLGARPCTPRGTWLVDADK